MKKISSFKFFLAIFSKKLRANWIITNYTKASNLYVQKIYMVGLDLLSVPSREAKDFFIQVLLLIISSEAAIDKKPLKLEYYAFSFIIRQENMFFSLHEKDWLCLAEKNLVIHHICHYYTFELLLFIVIIAELS